MNQNSSAQTLTGTYLGVFDFQPSDFEYYQKRPLWQQRDGLLTNSLYGSLLFNHSDTLVKTENAITIPSPDANYLEELTIEFWIKVNENENRSSNAYLFSYYDGTRTIYLRNPSALKLCDGQNSEQTNASLLDNTWHHLAIVLKQGQPWQLFLDTQPVNFTSNYTYDGGNASSSYKVLKTGTFFLGNYHSSQSSYWLDNSLIGNVRIWGKALSLSTIVLNAGNSLGIIDEDGLALYWGDSYSSADSTILDLSANGAVGSVAHPSEPNVWNSTEAYGSLLDDTHLEYQVTNMSGYFSFNSSNKSMFFCNHSELYINAADTDSLTVEAWVKPSSTCTADSTIWIVFTTSSYIESNQTAEIFSLTNPSSLTVNVSGEQIDSQFSILDGRWHHVAATRVQGGDVALYVDGVEVIRNSVIQPDYVFAPIPNPFALHLGSRNSSDTEQHFFSGGLSEFRIWSSIRSQEEIYNDGALRCITPPTDLQVYYPCARDLSATNKLENFSLAGNANDARVSNSSSSAPIWFNDQLFGYYANGNRAAPTLLQNPQGILPALSTSPSDISLAIIEATNGQLLAGATDDYPCVTQAQLSAAFQAGHDEGNFDPVVFPNIYGIKLEDKADVITAMQDIDFDTFLGYWIAGLRLNITVDSTGLFQAVFIPKPKHAGPLIFLIYKLKISSFFGELDEGQVVRTFSLMPGEAAYASVSSYTQTTTSREESSSFFDSNSLDTQSSLEESIKNEQGIDGSLGASLDFHADASIVDRWGLGNVKGNAGLDVSGNAALSAFFNSTSSALQQHASQASAVRNVDVNTSYSVTTDNTKETSLTREFKNINNSRTLNIIFRQLNQSFEIIQHITDIKVGYIDPGPRPYQVVSLQELDFLLGTVLLDDPAKRLAYKQTIIKEALQAVDLSQAAMNSDFIKGINRDDGTQVDISAIKTDASLISASDIYYVDQSAKSEATMGGNTVEIPGILMKQDTLSMRTDNVVADLELGANSGLDDYAAGLQAQTVRLEEYKADQLNAATQQMQLAQSIISLAASDPGTAKLQATLYREMFPQSAVPNNSGTIVYQNDGSKLGSLAGDRLNP